MPLSCLQSVLGYELRKEGEPHDCLEDARAAMKLVIAKIETGVDKNIPLNQTNVSFLIWFIYLFPKMPFD